MKCKNNFWYHKIDFLISQIWFCDVKKITMILWYQKVYFVTSQTRIPRYVISQNQFCAIKILYLKIWFKKSIYDITNSMILLSQNQFWYHKIVCDITNYRQIILRAKSYLSTYIHMSRVMRKCVLFHMRTTKAQISLISAFVFAA